MSMLGYTVAVMSLRHAVLGLLADSPASGYDLMKVFNKSLANVWPATQSQLYGELSRLAEQGLLEVSTEGPRRRKEYAVTEKGREELHHWLTVERPDRVTRNEALLRVFFLGELAPDEVRTYLRGEAEAAEQELAELRALREAIPWGEHTDDAFARYGGLVLEYGLMDAEKRRSWARWALAEAEEIAEDLATRRDRGRARGRSRGQEAEHARQERA